MFLGFDYDDYINWGEWERGPQKNLKKRQAANNKPKIGAHTSGQARSDRRLVENFFYLFFFFWGGGIF